LSFIFNISNPITFQLFFKVLFILLLPQFHKVRIVFWTRAFLTFIALPLPLEFSLC
jgi:hypothetical protein